MPEQVSDEQVEHLFAKLRADAMVEILPPGAAAAHRSVRRRRATGSATAGVVAMLMMAGFLVMAEATFAPHDGTPGQSATTGPLSDSTVRDLARRAEAGLVAVGGENSQADEPPVVAQENLPLADRGWGRPVSAIAGTYRIRVACVGEGTVAVTVHSGSRTRGDGIDLTSAAAIGATTIGCLSGQPNFEARSINVRQPRSELLMIEAVADDQATGRAGFAYQVERLGRRTTSETNGHTAQNRLLVEVADGAPLPHAGSTDYGGAKASAATRTATFYHHVTVAGRLRLACVGPGSIEVEVTITGGSATGPTVITCRSTPQISDIPLEFTAPAAITIAVRWDDAAAGRAGYSYLLPG